jgi:paraquat-inducible protein A
MDRPLACPACGLVQRVPALEPGSHAQCVRCGEIITERRKAGSLGRTAALSLAGLILYVPANAYPILSMNLHGARSDNTIWEGSKALFESGQWFAAVVVFAASIVIPLLKLVGLFFLVATARRGPMFGRLLGRRNQARIHRFIELIGPWAMLDVFLMAILVALVKLEQLATILPGPGLAAFTGVVVLTLLASASFDPKLVWAGTEEFDGHRAQAA